MVTNGIEHRKSKRYGVKGSAVQYKPDSFFNLFRHISKKYIVLDISRTGLQFITPEQFREHTRLELHIHAPRLYEEMIQATGQVIWVKSAPELKINVVGVEFTHLAKPDQSRLKMILDNALLEKVVIHDSVHLKKAEEV